MKKLIILSLIFFLYVPSSYGYKYTITTNVGTVTIKTDFADLCHWLHECNSSIECIREPGTIATKEISKYINQLKTIVEVRGKDGSISFQLNGLEFLKSNPKNAKFIKELSEQVKWAKEGKVDKFEYLTKKSESGSSMK